MLLSSFMYRLLSAIFPLYVIYVHSLFYFGQLHEFPYGLAVRIPGFHPGGQGSTPGMGTHFSSVQTTQVFSLFFLSSTETSYVEFIKVRCSFSTTLLQELLNALRLSFKRKYISNQLKFFLNHLYGKVSKTCDHVT